MSSIATTGIPLGTPTGLAPVFKHKLDNQGGSHCKPTAFDVDREASERKSVESLILLFLRVAAGLALLAQTNVGLLTAESVQSAIFAVLTDAAAILLLSGLCTPFAGTLTALIEVGNVLSHSGNPWTCIQLGAIGAALAMMGPGEWSLDARCFGKRIDSRLNSFAHLGNPLRKSGAPRYLKRVIQ